MPLCRFSFLLFWTFLLIVLPVNQATLNFAKKSRFKYFYTSIVFTLLCYCCFARAGCCFLKGYLFLRKIEKKSSSSWKWSHRCASLLVFPELLFPRKIGEKSGSWKSTHRWAILLKLLFHGKIEEKWASSWSSGSNRLS